MSYKLAQSLRSRLDFVRATQDEVREPIDLLPSRTVERAVVGHEDEIAKHIEAKASKSIALHSAETVWAPKAGHIGRYRPITGLGFDDRVMLRALTNELSEDIPSFDRSFKAQQAFQQLPVGADAPYVVIADVSAFYFFVDHELLASRLVDLTARADGAEAITVLLDGVIGRPYGLPQDFGPSAPLSEAFIGPVERRLLRAGVQTFRSNDDFRLCADTWGAALQALERLQEEVNQVGLDLNDEKSWILKLGTYSKNLGLIDGLIREALAAVDPGLPTIDLYTGEPVEDEDSDREDEEPEPERERATGPQQKASDGTDDPGPALTAAAERLLEHTSSRRLSDQQMTGFERSANRNVLFIALQLLTRARSDAAVEIVGRMVAIDPLLARPYVAYLRALPAEGIDTADRVQMTLSLFRGHVPFWTQAWLINALLDPGVVLTDEVQAWLESLLGSRAPAVLRMRAAIALASHQELGATTVAEMLDKLPVAARPDAVAAMAIAGGVSHRHTAFPDDRLLQRVYELVSEHREDPAPFV